MKTIAVYSSKGGVGKTATTVNLAFTASRDGYRVLLCDMDSQGAASYYYRIKPKKKFNRSRLLNGEFYDFIRGTDFPLLDLLPAHFSFRNLDIAINDERKEEKRQVLASLLVPLADQYDYVILDCPPNVTVLSENIITAADCVVVPVVPTTLSLLAL
ncbi:ParA family protein, partial [Thermodesulfobacteriota bacterium]